MKKLLASSRFALWSVLMIWFLVRLYPITHTEPLTFTEVAASRKLLDYGFFELRGARLAVAYWTGTLPHPEAFRYMHYPLPMYWLLTFIFYLAGQYGVLAFVLFLKLAACVLVFKILDRHFERFAAWFGSVLFAVAPCSIILDPDTDLVAVGAILWPIGVYGLMARPIQSKSARWLSVVAAFCAGQIAWFTLTVIPSLMAYCESWTRPVGESLRALMRNKTALLILTASVASFACFLVQVVIYDPEIHQLIPFLRVKMGASKVTMPRSQLLTLFPLRTVLFIGVALIVGLVAGLRSAWRKREPLLMAALVYLPSFVLAALLIPHYFYMENMVYGSLLFPAAVLTTLAIQESRRWLVWLLAALAVPGMIYGQLFYAVPMISPAARVMADFVSKNTMKSDMVLTNLKGATPPFKSSDIWSGKATRVVSDRLIFFEFGKLKDLDTVPVIMKSNAVPVVYLLSKSGPIEPALLEKLHRDGQLETAAKVVFPPQELNVIEKLRAFVWYKVMRKGVAPASPAATVEQRYEFEIYRLEKGSVP